MRILMAGAAALALAASGAYAQPGNGKGQGNNGSGKPDTAQQQKGKGGGNADRGLQHEKRSDNRGGGNAQADRGPQRQTQSDNRGGGNAQADRGNSERGNNRSERGNDRRDVRIVNGNGNRRDGDRGSRNVRVTYDRNRGHDRNRDWDRDWLRLDNARGLVNGCPPGLAKKRNGCNPPGQVKGAYDYRRSIFGGYYRPSLFGLLGYDRGSYYYRDGYLVRYGRDSISGWIPLLGGALGVGNVWPVGYDSYYVPDYYVDYYNLGGRDRYRYADHVIYRVDPEDAAITSIAALITGDTFAVGQPMPMGYDVYNVPYAYRGRYYDTPRAMYRYSDGYVYRIDPETRLVAAVIDLLV